MNIYPEVYDSNKAIECMKKLSEILAKNDIIVRSISSRENETTDGYYKITVDCFVHPEDHKTS